MADTEGTDVVPQEQKAGWSSFIKSLASMTGDLSAMTAPPFILSPVSLTEFPAYWGERPELFADISTGKNEMERAEKVLRWFLGTLKGSYTTRNEKLGSEKKPLNPVLGEQFFGVWPAATGRGETTLSVEQVSHHPPITAYYLENKEAGVALQGFSGQKTSFSGGSIIVKQNGHAILTISLKNGKKESYLITLPRLSIQGLLWGSPYIELTESTAIASSTGYVSNIEYRGKGWVSGKPHSYKAVLSHNGTTLKTYEGSWTGIGKVRGTEQVFTDGTVPRIEVTVKPIDEQGEWESRKLWKKVADGIRTGDYDFASKDKTRIENEQRQRRKDEAAAGTPWELILFDHVDSDPGYKELAKAVKGIPEDEDGYVFKHPQVK